MQVIGILDYGLGNLRSVYNAFQCFNAEIRVCAQGADLHGIDKIVLPGVGAFDAGMQGLQQRGFLEPLADLVLSQGTPFLGFCLGLQLVFEGSDEGGQVGLAWIRGRVTRLHSGRGLKVPHIGWNEVRRVRPSILLKDLPSNTDFYFVHSFAVFADACEPNLAVGITDYGTPFVSVLEVDNIMAAQFHPEKSQLGGMKLIENFLSL